MKGLRSLGQGVTLPGGPRRPTRLAGLLGLVLIVVLAGVGTVPTAATAQQADPDEDVLGWEDGRWYDETIAVDRSDGLNQTELHAVVSRSMARVEQLRRLEFKERVPVSIISRADYRNRTDRFYANASAADRLHQNVKFESLFMVGEDTNALDVQAANRGSNVLGYYNFAADEIVIVSDSPSTLEMNEITLAQELFHALQDQYFNLSRYDRSTEERNNAVNGIVEGDGNYVDHLYRQRCDSGGWGSCLLPQSSGGGGSLANVGLYLLAIQPYTDGPAFVKRVEDQLGWSGVNEVYGDPPESSEQVIHPERYGLQDGLRDSPTNVTITDRSSRPWRVLELPGSKNFAEFGEAGIFSMLLYPAFDPAISGEVVSSGSFFTGDQLDPYNYDARYSAGWDGDRLLPYVTDESADTNETGYVWKTVWDSTGEAQEFATGYRELLRLHGAERVEPNTYVVPSDSRFADAFHLLVDDHTVTIVNGPTVDDLPEIHGAIAVATPTPAVGSPHDTVTISPRPTTVAPESPRDTSTVADRPTSPNPTPTERTISTPVIETTTPGQPGFGTIGLALAIALLGLLARRRDRSG